ncbi:FecR domain-containing protein [Dyadobacter sp. 22481]|uniref:FecR domain-containing protein n=1 Tax=Dyadobacter sp. 22481 TaxID=3453926 RepID=UPI003F875A2D
MDESSAKDLLRKYRDNTLTDEEMALLESWYLARAKSANLALNTDELEKQLDMVWESLPLNQERALRQKTRTLPLLKWVGVAASVVIAATIGLNFFRKAKPQPPVSQGVVVGDAIPGDNRAKLTLANGQSIMLHEAVNGKLAQQGQTAVIKTKQGEIVYEFETREGSGPSRGLAYNTISTPRAGQYRIKLPDGTGVWLNAASSIRFPTVFPTEERVVEIVGEAYFEVAKVSKNSKRVPFKVRSGNQIIEVLGTRFNVNSYADEGAIKTTLLEGSIKLKVNGAEDRGVLLKPGDQARLVTNIRKNASQPARPFEVKQINTSNVIAWKEGYFRFDNVGLPELMRQLARWYDMEVVYEGTIKDYEFVGQIERDAKLSKVLRILELGDVHFKIDNKKIIVTN